MDIHILGKPGYTSIGCPLDELLHPECSSTTKYQ